MQHLVCILSILLFVNKRTATHKHINNFWFTASSPIHFAALCAHISPLRRVPAFLTFAVFARPCVASNFTQACSSSFCYGFLHTHTHKSARSADTHSPDSPPGKALCGRSIRADNSQSRIGGDCGAGDLSAFGCGACERGQSGRRAVCVRCADELLGECCSVLSHRMNTDSIGDANAKRARASGILCWH